MKGRKPERIDTRDVVLEFGKHEGTRIQNVPVGYLRWMVNRRTRQWEWAEAELDRRGSVIPEIEISGHAIDTASLRIRRTWHEHRGAEEGLHAWLARSAWDAWNLRESQRSLDSVHLGVRWVFELDGVWPVLKSVMPASGRHRKRERAR